MTPKENNFAYIDGANLHKGLKSLGWELDYKKFRIWLRDKYGIVSSDGDYVELVHFLREKGALHVVVSPNRKCSYLLRKQNIPLLYLHTQRKKIEYISSVKEKAPDEDKTS